MITAEEPERDRLYHPTVHGRAGAAGEDLPDGRREAAHHGRCVWAGADSVGDDTPAWHQYR